MKFNGLRKKTFITILIFLVCIFGALLIEYSQHPEVEAVIGGIGNLTDPSNKHNLSISGPGPIKAQSETRICIFCHTPHYAITDTTLINAPLWNHTLSTATIDFSNTSSYLINSTTMPSHSIDGASKLCMSCHDGTVAVGELASGAVLMTGACLDSEGRMTSACPGWLGTAPSHHIFSVPMNDVLITDSIANCTAGITSTRLKYPWESTATAPANDEVLLRPTAQEYRGTPGKEGSEITQPGYKAGYNYGVQCSTCHDPHLYHENALGDSCEFLVGGACVDNYDPLCVACHSSDCP